MENASHKYSQVKIREMIREQKSKHNWEFIFLGANMDAEEVAGRFGIERNRAQSFHNDSKGIQMNYAAVSEVAAKFRAAPASEMLDDDWSAEIERDFVERGGKKRQA
jgi:hypothetical protein